MSNEQVEHDWDVLLLKAENVQLKEQLREAVRLLKAEEMFRRFPIVHKEESLHMNQVDAFLDQHADIVKELEGK